MTLTINGIIYKFAPKSVNIKIGDTYGNMIKDDKDNVISVTVGTCLDQKSADFHNNSENTRLLFNKENENK